MLINKLLTNKIIFIVFNTSPASSNWACWQMTQKTIFHPAVVMCIRKSLFFSIGLAVYFSKKLRKIVTLTKSCNNYHFWYINWWHDSITKLIFFVNHWFDSRYCWKFSLYSVEKFKLLDNKAICLLLLYVRTFIFYSFLKGILKQ